MEVIRNRDGLAPPRALARLADELLVAPGLEQRFPGESGSHAAH
jgi:hypothetical protein